MTIYAQCEIQFLNSLFRKSLLSQGKSDCMIKKHESFCHRPEQYSLENLRIRKPTKSSSISQLAFDYDYRTNEKEIKVISPFYDRAKCAFKGPCLCPFHRKKRLKLVQSQKSGLNLSPVDQRAGQGKYRKINTEQCQKSNNFNKIKKNGNRDQKQGRNAPYSQLQNYFNVAHKVECRNSQFENFLKRNELYILTGKFPVGSKNNKQIRDEFCSDEQFLQTIYNSFDADGNFYTDSRSKERKKTQGPFAGRDFNRKGTRQKTSFKKFGEEGIINRMRALVELIINGQKKMSLKSMGKLRNAFSTLIEQQKEIEESSVSYLKNKACLDCFDAFLEKLSKRKPQSRVNISGTTHLSGSKLRNSGTISNKNHRVSMSFKVKQDKQDQGVNEVNQKDGALKVKNNPHNSNNPHSKMVMFNMNDNSGKINQAETNVEQVNEQSINQGQYTNENAERLQQLANKRKERAKAKKYATSKARNHSQLLKELNLGKNSKEMEKAQQNRDEAFSKSNNSHHHYQSVINQKKNQKQAKLQQILNHIKDEEVVDINYLKMKKYIEKNKKFIKKMEMKLLNYNLGVFVIEESDSLITRKKKIRCLKELLANSDCSGEAKRGFYDEIMKYLDIYTEHCNMVMKKQMKKKNDEDFDFNYEDEAHYDVLTSKDYNKSLKFINLYENLEFQREKKLQGWISIPQYITNDETRLKTFQIEHKSVKRIQKSIQNEHLEHESEKSFDSLVQEEMHNKCLVQNYKFNDNTFINKNSAQLKGCQKIGAILCKDKNGI